MRGRAVIKSKVGTRGKRCTSWFTIFHIELKKFFGKIQRLTKSEPTSRNVRVNLDVEAMVGRPKITHMKVGAECLFAPLE